MTAPKTSYRGCAFLSAVLDLPPGLRQKALSSISAGDLTSKPHRIVYVAMCDMPNFDKVDGRMNAGLAVHDYLTSVGAFVGEFGYAVQQAMLDISDTKSTGDDAFPLALKLREDTFRRRTVILGKRLAQEGETAPRETILDILAEAYGPLIALEKRSRPTKDEPRLKVVK